MTRKLQLNGDETIEVIGCANYNATSILYVRTPAIIKIECRKKIRKFILKYVQIDKLKLTCKIKDESFEK